MSNVTDITNNVLIVEKNSIEEVIGDGFFDKLMETVTTHLSVQYNNGRIKGEQYPALYAQLMQVVLQLSVTNAIEQDKLKQQLTLQKPISDASVKSEEAKAKLYERQTKGFDDDAKTKILKELGTIYGLAFSVAKDDPNLVVPKCITGNTLDNLASDLLDLSHLGSMNNGSIGFSQNPFSNVTPR